MWVKNPFFTKHCLVLSCEDNLTASFLVCLAESNFSKSGWLPHLLPAAGPHVWETNWGKEAWSCVRTGTFHEFREVECCHGCRRNVSMESGCYKLHSEEEQTSLTLLFFLFSVLSFTLQFSGECHTCRLSLLIAGCIILISTTIQWIHVEVTFFHAYKSLLGY